MDLLTVVKAPCVPFSSRSRGRAVSSRRSQRRSRIARCAAEQKPEEDKQDSLVKQFGRVCAPFAAAMLLLVEFRRGQSGHAFLKRLGFAPMLLAIVFMSGDFFSYVHVPNA